MTARQVYLDSHPSISASMDDFEAREFSPTLPERPSQHSGFRSARASEYSESSSERRSYSPPAWRKAGSGWFNHQSLSPTRGEYHIKEPTPQYHGAEEDGDGDVTAYRIATRVPLPGSPIKGRSPSNSPEPNLRPDAGDVDRGGGNLASGSRLNVQADEFAIPALETSAQSNCKFALLLYSITPTLAAENNLPHLHMARTHCARRPHAIS